MRVFEMYFSPTGTTEKIVKRISTNIAEKLNIQPINIDFTLKVDRKRIYNFEKGDLVIIGTPVYAGRVPNVLLEFLNNNIFGNSSFVVPVVLFGNRNFDEALNEMLVIMKKNNFINLGGAAFVGEHSFSKILGKNRPDTLDFDIADKFSQSIIDRMSMEKDFITIDDSYKIKPYYTPRDRNGNAINILKVKPKTNDSCDNCGICVKVCPMNSICAENPREINGICIKCGACEKKCPIGAKFYDDENYLYHKTELEEQFIKRAQPTIF